MMNRFRQKLAAGEFVITAELFPPKGTDISTLAARADIIGPLVDAINVTDNQRASMRLGSLAVCRLLQEKGYTAVMQMTCRDRNRIALQSDLLSAAVLGIENILILSGDHPKVGEYREAKIVYDLDPVQLLTAARMLETGVDLAGKKVNGSPSFCLGAVANPAAEPLELQVAMIEKKARAGAGFFQTQPVFDLDQYARFRERIGHLPVKMLPGVALLKSVRFIHFLNSLPGVAIPEDTVRRMEAAEDQLAEGIAICAETIRGLRSTADGVHIMAIGMEEYIPEILRRAGI